MKKIIPLLLLLASCSGGIIDRNIEIEIRTSVRCYVYVDPFPMLRTLFCDGGIAYFRIYGLIGAGRNRPEPAQIHNHIK